MVASRQVEISYYRAVGRQRGRGFGVLAQTNGRTAIPFFSRNVVAAAKRISADMLEFDAKEIGEVISGKNLSSRLQRLWESKLRKNSWVAVVNREESFQQNLLNNPFVREETFLQTILVDLVKQQSSVPTFCGSVWKPWRESPNC